MKACKKSPLPSTFVCVCLYGQETQNFLFSVAYENIDISSLIQRPNSHYLSVVYPKHLSGFGQALGHPEEMLAAQ